MATKLKAPELSQSAAAAFAEKWKSYTNEKQHAHGFWSEFFRTLCGVDDEEIAGIEYEKKVKSSLSGNQEYIDVYWKNVALIEHKSAGENLDNAELQARGYLKSLPPGYRPRTIIISDFANFRLIDEKLNRTHQFTLAELPNNIHRFESIISGSRPQALEEEITVDQVAAKLMANLYLELESHGFEGHETSIFLIRLLFLMFGDDTGMWERNLVKSLILRTKEDGSDVGKTFDTLFMVLNTVEKEREKKLDQHLMKFPYVNGGIFSESISIIDFNRKMRVALIDVANYDWASINPTIFGAMFQLIKSKDARRELGEHYTSEENINKIVYPLFLDELQERLASSWDNKKELKKLRQDLAKIKILDPACGCGNFLVVSYRHLRQLELELVVRLNHLEGVQDSMQLDGSMGLSITLNQFYGIEIEEWPAQVARMALFLTDHQENIKLERITGLTPRKFPIKESANIINGNALDGDWGNEVEIDQNTFILGNPPFGGSTWQSAQQKEETARIWNKSKGYGLLDYVTNWFAIAARKVNETSCKAAFVATNSIVQGTHPGLIWQSLSQLDVEISFAHRSFNWTNDSSGQAGVHCVVVGLSKKGFNKDKRIWSYEQKSLIPMESKVKNINAYLLDAPNILILSRQRPLSRQTKIMDNGSKPTDDGYLSNIDKEIADEIKATDLIAAKYLRRIVGGRELIHSEERYCLWLVNATPADIRNSKVLTTRVKSVREFRAASNKAQTRRDADSPTVFQELRQPSKDYLAVPIITSELRSYVPMKFLKADEIINNKISFIEDCDLVTFAVLNSSVFNCWNKSVSGRTRNDTVISNKITYNNFPFIEADNQEVVQITSRAKSILEVRKLFPSSSLADLYDETSMPSELLLAHKELDKVILKLYKLRIDASEAEIMSTLFRLYVELSDDKLL
jgi:hypothetical protein